MNWLAALVLAVSLAGCSFQTAPTRETLVDSAGNKVTCADQLVVHDTLNTSIYSTCTKSNPNTVLTIRAGNTIGGAGLATINSAVSGVPVILNLFK